MTTTRSLHFDTHNEAEEHLTESFLLDQIDKLNRLEAALARAPRPEHPLSFTKVRKTRLSDLYPSNFVAYVVVVSYTDHEEWWFIVDTRAVAGRCFMSEEWFLEKIL